ncbi:MAG: hypothetical protein N2450_00315 [bacterium]|nr:hypothetical protein [bacterium]
MVNKNFLFLFLAFLIGVSFYSCKTSKKETQLLKKDCQEIIQQAQEWYGGLDTQIAMQYGYSKLTFRELGKLPETLSNNDLTWTNQNGSYTISDRTSDSFTLTAVGMEEEKVQYFVVKNDPVKEPKIFR